MDYKRCLNCLEVKTVSNFHPSHSTIDKLRVECRKCTSLIIRRRVAEKNIEKYPWRFVECDECDHIFAKRDYCPRCKSKNLINYSKEEI